MSSIKFKLMATTLEERIIQLETAHSRLYNRLNQIEKDFKQLVNVLDNKHLSRIYSDIEEIKDKLELKTIEEFKIGANYVAIVDEIISKSEPVEWKNNKFHNYELKFQHRPEIYSAFISSKYNLSNGARIKFTLLENFKLSQIKIYV